MEEDDVEEQQEEQMVGQEDQRQDAMEEGFTEGYGSPQFEEKPSPFQFFNKVMDADTTNRVSNLKDEELGTTRLSVRDYLTLANFQATRKFDRVADYLKRKAAIVSDTALSRDGFMMNLSITQKRERIKKGGKKDKWNK